MTHGNVRWNPVTRQWFCTKCGRTADQSNVDTALEQLDQYECQVPSVEVAATAPGTETIRLIRKPYKMTLRTERGGSRFVVRTEEGKPVIQLELFHDTLSLLASVTIGFELLSGVTPDQARTLVDAMNERIVGVVVTSK
jgi:hypothetical protein